MALRIDASGVTEGEKKLGDNGDNCAKTVRDHFVNPRNIGQMDEADGFGKSGIECGEARNVWITVKDETLADVRYAVDGCASAVATCSMMSELAIGMSIDEAAELSGEHICEAFGVLGQECLYCADQAALALYNAIMNYVFRSASRSSEQG